MNPSVVVHQLDARLEPDVEVSVLGVFGGVEVLTVLDIIHHSHMTMGKLRTSLKSRSKAVLSKETVKDSGVWQARELDHVLLRGVIFVMSKEDEPLLFPQVALKDELYIANLGDVREVEVRLSKGEKIELGCHH